MLTPTPTPQRPTALPASSSVSVIVTITRGAAHTGRCLEALKCQINAPDFEILVPYHPALDQIEEWQRAHPDVKWVRIPQLPQGALSGDAGIGHLVFDVRRATGLRAACGQIVAITEDHAIPAPDWCARIVAEHRTAGHAVIGGAIDPLGSGNSLNWALYFCDFGRYQNPVSDRASRYVSDVNVSYKRAALERVRHTWVETYHETTVHETLQAMGETLWLSPRLIVHHDRGPLTLRRLLAERYAWARLFAGRRFPQQANRRRLLHAASTPLLPWLLLARRAKEVLRRRRHIWPFLQALPVIWLLCAFWAGGELVGYLTAEPVSSHNS